MANVNKEKVDKPSVPSKNRTASDAPSNSSSESSLCSISSHDEFFTSKNHADSNLMKMYRHFLLNQLTDVTLIAGETTVRAHRLVLSSASDYFNAMFTGDLLESRQEKVELHGICGTALKDLVNYCYTGLVEIREDSVETLLSTASLLGLNKVVEACSTFLKQQLDPSNCIGIALFADSRNCIELKEAAFKFTADHFVEVIKNQEFLMLPAEEVAKLLQSDELNVPSEEDIFHGIMSWIDYDKETRTKDIVTLLDRVKLPLLSSTFLADVVGPRVKDNPQANILLVEAFKYHLLPERRSDFYSWRTVPRKSTVGYLYAVGGMDSNKVSLAGATSIEVYNPRKDKWSTIGSMAGRKLQFGLAALDSKLVVVGGRDGLKTLNSAEFFCLDNRNWFPLVPMSTHRHGLGLALIPNVAPCLYAVGGHDGWSYLNTVERWDPVTGQWTYVAPMTTQRSTVGVAVLHNRLYAVGGRDGVSCLRSVEVYDPHINKWTSCSPMSKRRGGVAVAVLDDCLYALGGHDVPTINSSTARFDCVERYDPKTDTWTNVACMNVGRDAIGVGVLGDQLLAVGGYDGQSYLRLVETYNPYLNTWKQVASLNTGRAGSCVVSVKGTNNISIDF